jgi:hypothetical protein
MPTATFLSGLFVRRWSWWSSALKHRAERAKPPAGLERGAGAGGSRTRCEPGAEVLKHQTERAKPPQGAGKRCFGAVPARGMARLRGS